MERIRRHIEAENDIRQSMNACQPFRKERAQHETIANLRKQMIKVAPAAKGTMMDVFKKIVGAK